MIAPVMKKIPVIAMGGLAALLIAAAARPAPHGGPALAAAPASASGGLTAG